MSDALRAENERLRERVTTQKQTIQAYRDESREWREVAEHAQAENAKLHEALESVGMAAYIYGRDQLKAENAKLRELAVEMYWDLVAEMPESLLMDRKQQLKELGIEVDAWCAKDGSRFSLPTFPTR